MFRLEFNETLPSAAIRRIIRHPVADWMSFHEFQSQISTAKG
jgi:hypothetical protein